MAMDPTGDDDSWHRVAEYPMRVLAEMAVQTLNQAGIQAWIDADDAGGSYPSLILDRPVGVFVRFEDHVRASNELGLES
jgi:hypothetical protein